jgi:hypothetical protein
MRDRAWRRHIKDTITIRRLKRLSHQHGSWWHFDDVNDIPHRYPILKDYIGTSYHFMYKTYVTNKGDTNYKQKYSPNKCKHRYRYKGGERTRETSKLEFLRILKEYGIK